jgi:hypothetical protein
MRNHLQMKFGERRGIQEKRRAIKGIGIAPRMFYCPQRKDRRNREGEKV